MRPTTLLPLLFLAACGSSQKPFHQMTAQEHRAAAAREHELADDAFGKVRGDDIVPPNTLPTDVYGYVPTVPYDPYYYELGDPETYIAWPRIGDPDEKHQDAASEHREKALRHESAAAALEGKPSPRPLPPPQEPLLPDEA